MLRGGDATAMARAFMITNEGWSHPLVFRLQPGDALHEELCNLVVRLLEPEPRADAPGHRPGRTPRDL